MPFDGSGNYTLPAAYVAVNATTITPTQHNTPLEDIQTALTACIKANGTKAFTAEQLVHGNPSNVLGIAPKQYVDAQVLLALSLAGVTIKAPALYCTTGNVSLTGEQTIDGTLTSASRVLVAFQTAPAENGIYVTGAGVWSRATDADSWAEVATAYVPVERGTKWADTLWRTSADTGGTLNTTAINWRRIDGQWLRNAQTGTTYTVTLGDHNAYVTHSNGSAIATTLPQATGTFGNGFCYISQNIGAGANTITPTTSTINGAATLIQRTGDAHFIFSDGTNYRAIALGMTYEQLVGETEDATGATGDFVLTADVSATLRKKIQLGTIQTLFAASQAQQETGTSNAVNVTPGTQKFHPLHPKAWCMFDGSTVGTNAPTAGSGVTSITRNATGNYTVNLAITFSGTTAYSAVGWCRSSVVSAGVILSAESGDTKTTTTMQFRARRAATDAAADAPEIFIMFFGDI